MFHFPIVLGRFRFSKGQVTALMGALVLLAFFYLFAKLNGDEHHHGSTIMEHRIKDAMDDIQHHQQARSYDEHKDKVGVPVNAVLDKSTSLIKEQRSFQLVDTSASAAEKIDIETTTVVKEDAEHVVGKFDDAYKHVNYTKFLSLQEQVKRMGALLQEKSEQLKRWTGWSGAVAEYFLTKERIVQTVPFKWEISLAAVEKLGNDSEYFHQLREAVNKARQIALRYKSIYDLNPDSCTCTHTRCSCCARVYVKRLSVDQRVCVNFTYTTQAMIQTKIYFGNDLAFDKELATKDVGEICLADTGNLLEICTQFLNLTMSVSAYSQHKTAWHGCLEFHVNLYDRSPAALSTTATAIAPNTGNSVGEKSTRNDSADLLLKTWQASITSTMTEMMAAAAAVSTISPPTTDIPLDATIEKVGMSTIASYPVGCFVTSEDRTHDTEARFGV